MDGTLSNKVLWSFAQQPTCPHSPHSELHTVGLLPVLGQMVWKLWSLEWRDALPGTEPRAESPYQWINSLTIDMLPRWPAFPGPAFGVQAPGSLPAIFS